MRASTTSIVAKYAGRWDAERATATPFPPYLYWRVTMSVPPIGSKIVIIYSASAVYTGEILDVRDATDAPVPDVLPVDCCDPHKDFLVAYDGWRGSKPEWKNGSKVIFGNPEEETSRGRPRRAAQRSPAPVPTTTTPTRSTPSSAKRPARKPTTPKISSTFSFGAAPCCLLGRANFGCARFSFPFALGGFL